jgi:hypothetical protein
MANFKIEGREALWERFLALQDRFQPLQSEVINQRTIIQNDVPLTEDEFKRWWVRQGLLEEMLVNFGNEWRSIHHEIALSRRIVE